MGIKKYRMLVLLFSVLLSLLIVETPTAAAQLSQNYYAGICPNVESVVRGVVSQRLQQSFAAGAGTLRLFFHDCFVRGCDASVLIANPNGDDEGHSGADLSLSADAIDLINKAKAAVDGDPQCTNRVSCADILAMAARDVVSLVGGPFYPVELGRLDGKVSTRAIVKYSLPGPTFNLDQLNSLFAANGLTQTDMIALSGAHTIGVSHCDKFIRRLYQFRGPQEFTPRMNLQFLRQMRQVCPLKYSPSTVAMLDASTPFKFDNAFYQNLQQLEGLLASDQILFADRRSRGTVNWFASNQTAFFDAFVSAMTKLGRVGVKTGDDGELRRVCTTVN
ncbi:peroxidase 16-like [Ananas comosus]|uniref:Peroxidase n=1 Tax=Ananas comosus TaxID=4615 RepID=A0A6P5FBV1_ANACO|nr:peroxidase 16-like [Ananas comosus]